MYINIPIQLFLKIYQHLPKLFKNIVVKKSMFLNEYIIEYIDNYMRGSKLQAMQEKIFNQLKTTKGMP